MRSRRTAHPTDSLVTAGWVLAFVFPLVGFIIGVILLTKGKVGHGVAICCVSPIGGFIFWGVALAMLGSSASS